MGTFITSIVIAGAILIYSALKSPREFHFPKVSFPSAQPDVALALWPDAVDDVGSAIRAGMSLPQAVCNLAMHGPTQLRPTFARVNESYLSNGNFLQALEHVRTLHQPVAVKFVSAISVAYQVGGSDLGSVLRALSDAVRDEVKLRGEIEARQSWTVNGARLAVAAPWVTVLLLSSRNSAAQIYTSSTGMKLLAACALLTGLAYVVMIRIGSLPDQDLVK